MNNRVPESVSILGLGLIGGSLGRALRTSSRIIGWDPDPLAQREALALDAVHSVAASAEEAAGVSDLVVLCAPVQSIVPLLAEIAPALRPSATVTDVGSTKRRIVTEAEALIGGRFIGGHPMAGSEESGIRASSADLFHGAPWLLTPTRRTEGAAMERAAAVAQAAGAIVRRMDPGEHDRVIAYISHLPHLLAYALASTAADGVPPECADLIAGSFRSGARVALSEPEQWTAILLDNRKEVGEVLDRCEDWLKRARTALESADDTPLRTLLARAHAARRQFPR